MIKAFYNSSSSRLTPKSSYQLFRRVDNNNYDQKRENRDSKSSKQQRSFPSLANNEKSRIKLGNAGQSLDNFKQNLMYEGYLQKVNSSAEIDQNSIVSNYLNSIRKDYDKMHKEIREQMVAISLKKKNIDFIKQRLKLAHCSVQSLQQKRDQKFKQMQRIKDKHEQVETQRHTLNHIILRMKKDQIFYKQFGRIFEGRLAQKKKKVKILNQNILLEDQKLHKMLLSIEDLKKQFDRNQQFRGKIFQDYCEKIENIHEKELFLQERKERTLELQAIQSNDILKAKNLQMRKIRLANKVVDSLLEKKIQKLIESYADIQNAFHTIQVKTSINDPSLIVSKFFSYEQTTENLLKSISAYELQLKTKNEKNQELKQRWKNLQEMFYCNDFVQEKQQPKTIYTQEKICEIQQKLLQYQTIIDWIDRQSRLLKVLIAQNEKQGLLERVVKKFTQICMKTKSQAQEVAKTFKHHQKFVTPGIRIKKIIKESNLQIKNQKIKQTQEAILQISVEEEFLKVARAGVKRNFLIKQKTLNIGNIVLDKSNNADSKMRISSNNS